ncbi:MAG: alpha/beta hydrolase family protein, partial [Candidatus Binatia bacterium]
MKSAAAVASVTVAAPVRLQIATMNTPSLVKSVILLFTIAFPFAQEYGRTDRENPGDEMIQQYLKREAEKIETDFLAGIKTQQDWERERPKLMGEYFHMLGLSPLPEKTPLHATITRTLDRGDYFVDMLHYQSRPGLYVTANVYRPAKVNPGEKLPAILYVCGHSGRGRSGNKTAFQDHGIWLARHGYVCLMVDTLQLGEIAGIHHGTYREGRWWWLSRGYTPAGVEAWNGIRGIDYLASRSDVDPERIGVTGISGGGAATFWIAAADERAQVAIPVSGMADLVSYLPSRMINGHCDCMFLYNTYQWHWTRIAGLIAPRPMLFVNSDNDPIFPMDANDRIINRLERLYSLYGASDRVDSFVSIGGHDYRKDIRQGVFRFLNTHLKNDPAQLSDTEVDLVTGGRDDQHPIKPEELRVFPKDENIPADALNAKIDEHFVPIGTPALASNNTGSFVVNGNTTITNTSTALLIQDDDASIQFNGLSATNYLTDGIVIQNNRSLVSFLGNTLIDGTAPTLIRDPAILIHDNTGDISF